MPLIRQIGFACTLIVLFAWGNSPCLARPENDPCGRSYPALLDPTCITPSMITTRGYEVQVPLEATSSQPTWTLDQQRIVNNHGRE